MKKQQNRRKENEGNLPKLLPSFSFLRPLLSLLPTTIYIKNNRPTFLCSSSTIFKTNQNILIKTMQFKIEFKPVLLQTQIHLNVQAKV